MVTTDRESTEAVDEVLRDAAEKMVAGTIRVIQRLPEPRDIAEIGVKYLTPIYVIDALRLLELHYDQKLVEPFITETRAKYRLKIDSDQIPFPQVFLDELVEMLSLPLIVPPMVDP